MDVIIFVIINMKFTSNGPICFCLSSQMCLTVTPSWVLLGFVGLGGMLGTSDISDLDFFKRKAPSYLTHEMR